MFVPPHTHIVGRDEDVKCSPENVYKIDKTKTKSSLFLLEFIVWQSEKVNQIYATLSFFEKNIDEKCAKQKMHPAKVTKEAASLSGVPPWKKERPNFLKRKGFTDRSIIDPFYIVGIMALYSGQKIYLAKENSRTV